MPTPRSTVSAAWLLLLAFLLSVSPAALAAPATPQDPAKAAADDAVEADEEPEVILYVTEWCPYCRKAQKLLDELEVDYVAKDIEKDARALAEFRAKGKGGGGIPLLDFEGKVIRGYQEKEIRRVLASPASRSPTRPRSRSTSCSARPSEASSRSERGRTG